MNYLRASVLLSLVLVFIASGVQAIPKVTRTGTYLYTDTGTRFYIKGIAYQNQGQAAFTLYAPNTHFLPYFSRHYYNFCR